MKRRALYPLLAVVGSMLALRAVAVEPNTAQPSNTVQPSPNAAPESTTFATVRASASSTLPTTADLLDRPFAKTMLPRIRPGTQIAEGAPHGWSRLIFKSRPRIGSGDLDKVGPSTLALIHKFSTAVLARVESDPHSPDRFHLAQVAVGTALHADGVDTVVASEATKELGIRFGLMESMALSECELQLGKIVLAARSKTMAVVDYPTNWLHEGKQVDAVFRHAYLVDPRDGRLYAVYWPMTRDRTNHRLLRETATLLPPNQILDWRLHVDASKFFLGAPSSDSFSATQFPEGTPLALPEEALPSATAAELSPNSAHRLELGLWRTLFPGGNRAAGK